MKATNLIVLVVFSLSFLGCKKDKIYATSEVLGKWKLVEEKVGSGLIYNEPVIFEAVESDKEIVFSSDGTFSSNGEMCTMSSESNGPSDGTFYESLLSIEPNGCASAVPSSGITYHFDTDTLYIHYPCYEECIQKYYKI